MEQQAELTTQTRSLRGHLWDIGTNLWTSHLVIAASIAMFTFVHIAIEAWISFPIQAIYHPSVIPLVYRWGWDKD